MATTKATELSQLSSSLQVDESTGRIIFTGSLDVDENTLFIDGGNNRVGVGTLTPASALDVVGNVSVSGTVDGRDVGSDGSKLDGIESGATGDQTASEIKSAYESNADTNAFTNAEQSKLSGIEDGATADQTKGDIDALGIDAETLDNLNSSQFLRSDTSDTLSGNLTVTGRLGASRLVLDNSELSSYTTENGLIIYDQAGNNSLNVYNSNLDRWVKIWDDSNDGSGSGLDADLLDGLNSTQFLRSDANNSFTGTLTSDNLGEYTLRVAGANADTKIIRVDADGGSTDSGNFGFTVSYRGDRTGNDNSLSIFSDDRQESTQIEALRINQNGDTIFASSVSKSSGSFRIDHPLPEKSETHNLIHSFVESPFADNIYRGVAELTEGAVHINIDSYVGMTEGTFSALNGNPQLFIQNETGWEPLKGEVIDNVLHIQCRDETSADRVSWMVVAERQDKHMLDTKWTDEFGRPILEPEKETEEGDFGDVEEVNSDGS